MKSKRGFEILSWLEIQCNVNRLVEPNGVFREWMQVKWTKPKIYCVIFYDYDMIWYNIIDNSIFDQN